MLSPKARFLQDDASARSHLDYTASAVFHAAADAAMLQLVHEVAAQKLTGSSDEAALRYAFIAGAEAFRRQFSTIAMPSKTPETVPTHNLNHTV